MRRCVLDSSGRVTRKVDRSQGATPISTIGTAGTPRPSRIRLYSSFSYHGTPVDMFLAGLRCCELGLTYALEAITGQKPAGNANGRKAG
jgi:hypothetical protein